MRYAPKIIKNKMIFNLEKPIYGSFYGIWDKWLKIAKEKRLKIVINFSEGTVFYKNVNEYLSGAKRLKRYFKNPNEPMIFYGRDLLPDLLRQKKEKMEEEKLQQPILPFETKIKLVDIWKKVCNQRR